jgi:hypothetical protein
VKECCRCRRWLRQQAAPLPTRGLRCGGALQHAATRCNALQRAATRCNAMQHAEAARRVFARESPGGEVPIAPLTSATSRERREGESSEKLWSREGRGRVAGGSRELRMANEVVVRRPVLSRGNRRPTNGVGQKPTWRRRSRARGCRTNLLPQALWQRRLDLLLPFDPKK